jgi:hypothetical protein
VTLNKILIEIQTLHIKFPVNPLSNDKLVFRVLNLANRRKVNNFIIKHYKKWMIYMKYLDGSLLPNIGSVVIISFKNFNRLVF